MSSCRDFTNRASSCVLSPLSVSQSRSEEEAETLIRLIVSFVCTTSDANNPFFNWTLSIWRDGQQIKGATAGESLDDFVPLEYLFGRTATFPNSTSSQLLHYEIDAKTMRKLRKGDLIVLSIVSDTSSSITLTGTVDMFFKE